MKTTLAVLGVLLTVCTADAQQVEVTVLHCGRVLDVRTGQLLADQKIAVRGNRIESVGATAPSGALVVDLTRATCLPGLIDMHTHLVGDATTEYDIAEPLKKSEAQMAYEALGNARATVEAGFTSVRDLGTFR